MPAVSGRSGAARPVRARRVREPLPVDVAARSRPAAGQPTDLVAARRAGGASSSCTPIEHVEHLADLSLQQFADVVAVWRERTTALWAEGHDYVMAFENHGSDVGATLPHLHGQIYAYGHLPPVTPTKLASHDQPPPAPRRLPRLPA